MPQLEMLLIFFYFAVPNRDVERQLMRTPIMAHATLPNLRSFAFKAVGAYSEAVLSRITASRLENFQICYPKQLTFFVPQLLQFIGRTEILRFDRAKFNFYTGRVFVQVNPYETNMPEDAFSINVDCCHLDWQVSSVAQIFNALSQTFSTVEHLTLTHEVHSQSSEEHNEVDRTEWRKLLRSFSNVKTLHFDDGLVRDLSRCLPSEGGEHPLELLPELQGLTYLGSGWLGGKLFLPRNRESVKAWLRAKGLFPSRSPQASFPGLQQQVSADAFTLFIDARQNAGRPVTLINSHMQEQREVFPTSPFATPLREKQGPEEEEEEEDSLTESEPARRSPWSDAFDREISWVAEPGEFPAD
jgi:hypothetical protein